MDEVPLRSIDHGTQNRIFFSLYSAVLTTMVGVGIVIPLLPRYVSNLGATGIWIGAIFSAFAFSRAIFLPVFGSLSDRHGRRRLILIGLCAYSLISSVYMIAGSVLEITAIRFLHGIASAMVLPIAIAYIGDIAPIGEEGKFVGSFASSISLGMSLGPLIGGVISDLFNMNAVFLSMTVLSLMAFLICLIFLPDIAPKQSIKAPIRTIILHKQLRGPILYQMLYAFANGTFMVFVPVIAIHAGNLSASEVGMVILVSVLSTTVFHYFFSRYADHFGRYYLIALGVGLIGGSLLIIPEFHGLIPYLICALLIGIGRGLSLPAMFALVTVAGRDVGQGSASGMVNTTLAVGLIISPLISGTIMDISGISTVFYLSGVISIIGMIIFVQMGRAVSHPG
ncbi:MAG TPA: MFS transporter [Methanospirillum sp.]|nr:MFS transporter [Methanospirillum sp.]